MKSFKLLIMGPLKLDQVHTWTIDDVKEWLEGNGFLQYVPLLCYRHRIDGKALLTLSENDLKSPPLSIQVLGDIKRLAISVHELQTLNPVLISQWRSSVDDSLAYRNTNNGPKLRRRRHRREASDSSDLNTFGSEFSDDEGDHSHGSQRQLKPEVWKTAVGMVYFFSVTWITAIVMVIVHDRVPDMQTYPPLPDIFLDNIPYMPWAFSMCELTGIILFLIWMAILFFHKHRFILLRRMFSLFGSVFLLRCITMIITSLSVPGKHLECKARSYGEWRDKIRTAFLIWLGGGMSIQGVRTCGDYMFSGHTVALTLLNFFITEYTPRSMYYLHTFTWVLNIFGVFFILAGHEHYSIDIFIAFYISTRLFLYYHALANNRAFVRDDRRRTRIWFPLFYFFESGVEGPVPNEYEWPVSIPEKVQRLVSQFFV
ncbi:sphingomyelin synthase-related protein 1 [Trichonephila clavata]|uniref:Sphingomyelin synthase-related protein 1 n=1 Tax=Trichonephila clavata TaxID=2740835 RepID=A0A8X6KYS4_TRICU|nr:sphingomyelin synthase-related protein 1 [Trichonephila clavata]